MEFWVRDIPAEGLDLSFEVDPAMLRLAEGGLRFQGPAHVRLSVSRQEDMVFVTGDVAAEAGLECVRCLNRFAYPLKLGIHAEYLSAQKVAGREEHELSRDELDVMFYTGGCIEFDDLVRDQMILGIPEYPLCSPDCRGLCQRCGQDLNAGRCRCPAETDPRFSALKDYFEK